MAGRETGTSKEKGTVGDMADESGSIETVLKEDDPDPSVGLRGVPMYRRLLCWR